MKDGGREQTGRKERSDCNSLLLQRETEQPEEMNLFGWPGGVYGRWVNPVSMASDKNLIRNLTGL